MHKYLHSRLMHFDVPTLYEMHYNSITLGKARPIRQSHALMSNAWACHCCFSARRTACEESL